MSESEAARILRIIGKYAWAAADEIDGKEPESKPEALTPEAIEEAKAEAKARRSRLGGNA